MGFYDRKQLQQARLPSIPTALVNNDGGAGLLGKFTDNAVQAFGNYRDRDIQENQDAAVTNALSQLQGVPIEERASQAGDLFRQFNESNQTPRYAISPERMQKETGILNQDVTNALSGNKLRDYISPEKQFNMQNEAAQEAAAVKASIDIFNKDKTIDANKANVDATIAANSDIAAARDALTVELARTKATTTGNKELRDANDREIWYRKFFPEATKEEIQLARNSEKFVDSANEQVKRKITEKKEIEENKFQKEGLAEVYKGTVSNKEIKNALKLKDPKDSKKYLDKAVKDKKSLRKSIDDSSSKHESAGLWTGDLEYDDVYISSGASKNKNAPSTSRGMTDYALKNPEFASALQAIYNNTNLPSDSIFGDSIESKLIALFESEFGNDDKSYNKKQRKQYNSIDFGKFE